MDEFKNKVNTIKYNSTNYIWNSLGLSSSWSLGFTSKLIKKQSFNKKEDWYEFYFSSGEERLKLISKLPEEEQKLLKSNNPKAYSGKNAYLNYNYGRTKEEIAHKGYILYTKLLEEGNKYNLELTECQFTAFFRTVAETWNGIYLREYNTMETLLNFFRVKMDKYVSFVDTTGEFDYKYAVDLELYYEGNIICGIQIKPHSYLTSTQKGVTSAKAINSKKNTMYNAKFNRNVFNIYSSQDGRILNEDILLEINKLLH